MYIIIVNGAGGSGKSTFEEFVTNYLAPQGKKVSVTSMAFYPKIVAEFAGWEGGKELKDRKFLSDLKLALAEWDDSPYKYVKTDICIARERDNSEIIFVDAREADDIDRIKNDYENVVTVLVKRDTKIEKYGNVADDNVYNYNYDYIIENTGTLDDLWEAAQLFYNSLKGEDTNA